MRRAFAITLSATGHPSSDGSAHSCHEIYDAQEKDTE